MTTATITQEAGGATSHSDSGVGPASDNTHGKSAGAPGRSQGRASHRAVSGGGRGGVGSNRDVTAPLRVSGGGSDQFRAKGADNSVQEYGEESDTAELQAAAEVVHRFYAARAEGSWVASCATLSQSLLRRFRLLAEKTPGVADASCASFMEGFTEDLSANEWRQVTTIDAGSLRRQGDSGLLIYSGSEETVYAMPLLFEGGAWKVNALSSDPLPSSTPSSSN